MALQMLDVAVVQHNLDRLRRRLDAKLQLRGFAIPGTAWECKRTVLERGSLAFRRLSPIPGCPEQG
jgi:hypothetical protein